MRTVAFLTQDENKMQFTSTFVALLEERFYIDDPTIRRAQSEQSSNLDASERNEGDTEEDTVDVMQTSGLQAILSKSDTFEHEIEVRGDEDIQSILTGKADTQDLVRAVITDLQEGEETDMQTEVIDEDSDMEDMTIRISDDANSHLEESVEQQRRKDVIKLICAFIQNNTASPYTEEQLLRKVRDNQAAFRLIAHKCVQHKLV